MREGIRRLVDVIATLVSLWVIGWGVYFAFAITHDWLIEDGPWPSLGDLFALGVFVFGPGVIGFFVVYVLDGFAQPEARPRKLSTRLGRNVRTREHPEPQSISGLKDLIEVGQLVLISIPILTAMVWAGYGVWRAIKWLFA